MQVYTTELKSRKKINQDPVKAVTQIPVRHDTKVRVHTHNKHQWGKVREAKNLIS